MDDNAKRVRLANATASLTEWLAPLAEMLSLSERPTEPAAGFALIAKYEQTRATAMRETGDGAYARLARRLFGAPATTALPK